MSARVVGAMVGGLLGGTSGVLIADRFLPKVPEQDDFAEPRRGMVAGAGVFGGGMGLMSGYELMRCRDLKKKAKAAGVVYGANTPMFLADDAAVFP